MEPLQLGQRVRIKSLDVKGEISHIDHVNYYAHHMIPIQVLLDKPLEDDSYQMKGASWYRTSVKDLARLKKKTAVDTKPKKKKQKEEIYDFSF